jgi:hypothetical protein
MDPTPRHWIAVACAEHVARGRALGIMQVGHGKETPLRRLRAGDRVAYYSPVQRLGGKLPVQSFTAYGTVRDERVYQVDMGDWKPFRRDVDYDADARQASIRPLLDRLSFARRQAGHWGQAFRFGLLQVEAGDMDLIAEAMGAACAASCTP